MKSQDRPIPEKDQSSSMSFHRDSMLLFNSLGDIRESGVCGRCHNRYTDTPVIGGQPFCPICDKI